DRSAQELPFSPQKLGNSQVKISHLPSLHVLDTRLQHFAGGFERSSVFSCRAHHSDPFPILVEYLTSLFGEGNAPGNKCIGRDFYDFAQRVREPILPSLCSYLRSKSSE